MTTSTDLEPRPDPDVEQRQMSMFADLEQASNLPAGSIRLMGLRLVDPDMPQQDWENLGRGLGRLHEWAQWAIGDWYLFGEAVYGEDASQATEATRAERRDLIHRVTGLAPDTIKNYASLCQRIPLDRRRPELKPAVHAPVSKLEPDEQDMWLQRAIDENWGREQLRVAIKGGDPNAPPADPDPGGPDPQMTPYEHLLQATLRAYHQAQPTPDGGAQVPPEPWAALVAAIGEE